MSPLVRTMAGGTLWTIVVWGNRVLLLDDNASWWEMSRVAISFGLGAALGIVDFALHRSQEITTVTKAVVLAFSAGMAIIWLPALFRVALGDYELAFKLVHTVLAGGSLVIGWILAQQVRV